MISNGMKIKIIFGFTAVIASLLFFSSVTRAATLYFAPDVQNMGIGGEFRINLNVDTQSASVNAVQATVKFSPSVLKLLDFDKSASVFNFWLEEPAVSEKDGTIVFTAGTTKGISGAALRVISLHFKTIGAGTAQITVTNAAVTASDGSGTNILSSIKGANIGVETEILAPSTPSVETPQKIVRPAVPAKGLPEKPKLRVPLYPDESRWYSHIGNVIVLWDLPADVTQVSVRLAQNQDARIGTPETELFNGKDLGIFKEGIWYVKVQFKNNIGWGDPAYHKVSLDTTAPLLFGIKINSVVSDNPSPEISYETNDSLSGIFGYLVLVDNKEIFKTGSSTLILPPQLPGKRNLTVRAIDFAGNSIEDNLLFEILPLETPVIEYYPSSIASGELLFLSGKAVAMQYVEVRLANSRNQDIVVERVDVNAVGHWELRVNQFLPQGIYTLHAVAKDGRGASSYPTETIKIRIREQILFSIGTFALGWFEITLLGLVIVLGGGWFLWKRYIMAEEKRAAYRVIAGRDIQKMGDLFEEKIKELEEWHKKQKNIDEKSKSEAEFIFEKIKDVIRRMKKYIGEEIKNIK